MGGEPVMVTAWNAQLKERVGGAERKQAACGMQGRAGRRRVRSEPSEPWARLAMRGSRGTPNSEPVRREGE